MREWRLVIRKRSPSQTFDFFIFGRATQAHCSLGKLFLSTSWGLSGHICEMYMSVGVCEEGMTSNCKREPSFQWRNDEGINEHHIPMKSPGSIQRRSECLKITEEAIRIPVVYTVLQNESAPYPPDRRALGKIPNHINITMQTPHRAVKTPEFKIPDVTCSCPVSVF